MATKSDKKVRPKGFRNWHAINAHFRKAGNMGDEKKELSRNKCRGRKDKNNDEWLSFGEYYQGICKNGHSFLYFADDDMANELICPICGESAQWKEYKQLKNED